MRPYDTVRSVHHVLETSAAESPDARAITFVDGPTLSRAELLDSVRRLAGGLARAGVGRGDRVALLIGNRPEFVTAYFALSWLGAVSVPLNTALRGDVLANMLETITPCRLIIEADLVADANSAITASGAVEQIWCITDDSRELPEGMVSFDQLTDAEPVEVGHEPDLSDLHAILFTSGTTGRSKGVMWSHKTALTFSEHATWVMGYTDEDVIYTCLPLFHINAMHTALLAGLHEGAPVVVSPRFSASRFWREVTDHGATTANMLGAMGAVLQKQAPRPEEQGHDLRLAMVVPFPVGHREELEKRFDVRMTELYGSTDTGIPLGVPHGADSPDSCGRPTPGWQVDLFDERDQPVPPGVPGELVTRPTTPFIGQLGYWREPEKTWEAHRNAWFHTGDVMTRDEEGWFHFQDRLKDALRVSGENVSSFEVEQVLLSHPGVAEIAVFAIPSDLGEDSIMACAVLEDGAELTPAELIEFSVPRLPYFAVPRYVEIVDALPKTTTQKVQKADLRRRGVTPSTWDGGQRRRSTR